MFDRRLKVRGGRAVLKFVSQTAAMWIVLGWAAQDVHGQTLRPDHAFYVASRAGFSFYDGDNTRQLRPVFGRPNGSSLALGFEAGYHFTRRTSVGLNYKFGNYPYATIDPGSSAYYTRRHSLQALARFIPLGVESRIAPVLIGGLHLTRGARSPGTGAPGRDLTAYGPSFGAGLDLTVNGTTTLFVEAVSNFSLPGEGFDGIRSSTGADLFGFLGFGARYSLKSARPGISVNVAGPATMETEAEGLFTAQLGRRSLEPRHYEWNFGDGTLAEGASVRHSYRRPGEYTVTLRAGKDQIRETSTFRVSVVDRGAGPATREEILRALIACDEILENAENAYVTGRFKEAIEMTGECIDWEHLSPEVRVRAYRLQSLAFSSDGNLDQARQMIHHILDIDPAYETNPVQDPPSFTSLVAAIRQQRAESGREDAARSGPAVYPGDYILPHRVLLFADPLGLTSLQIAELRAVGEVVDDVQASLIAEIEGSPAADDEDRAPGIVVRSERAERQLRSLYRNAEQQVLQVLTRDQRERFTALSSRND